MWSVIEPLVNLDDEERGYLERAHAGELFPELLFPNDDEASDLTRRPRIRTVVDDA